MKTISRFIIAALAASITFPSCTKDDTTRNGNDARVFTAVFDAATKSALTGQTPVFADGDKILITNGQDNPDVRTISVDASGKASFTTELTGDLKAIYPYGAEVMDDELLNIVGFKVPATQSGKFADANIALATFTSEDLNATFVNQTAVLKFYVDAAIGVQSIKVESSTTNIADGSKTITVDPSGDVTLDTVTDNPEKRICYVSVLPGVNASTLTFTSTTTTQGTVTRSSTADKTLAASTMYNAFIPYCIDLGTAGKWGYCNVGAFLPEEPGLHFSWGNVTGYAPTGGAFAYSFDTTNYDTSAGASLATDIPANSTYDAATAAWGAGWRIPTSTEFTELSGLENEWSSSPAGKIFGTSPNVIFLPAAGYGSGTALNGSGSFCCFWSSTLVSTDTSKAVSFSYFFDTNYSDIDPRVNGQSIRPFFDTL